MKIFSFIADLVKNNVVISVAFTILSVMTTYIILTYFTNKKKAELYNQSLAAMAKEAEEQKKNFEFEIQTKSVELEKILKKSKKRDEIVQQQFDKINVIRKNILLTKIDDWKELKFSVKYNALEEIGCDFYDIFRLRDNKIGLLIGDVSVRGLPAVLFIAMTKNLFVKAVQLYDSPKRIFQEVNKNIKDIFKGNDSLTCFMAVIDDEYNVTYSNAGHQKAIVFRKEGEYIDLLDTNGLVIGALEDTENQYEEKTTKLNYGDRLILYTDGIPNAQDNEGGENYSNKRLERLVIENNDLSLDDFTESILRDVHKHTGRKEAADDMSVFAVELVFDEAVEIIKSSRKLINNHKYLDAVKFLENGLVKYPDNQKILYNLGKGYFRIKNYDKSIQLLDRYIKKDKNNKYAFYINGAAHYQMMNYGKAADNFAEAAAIDPNMTDALLALGMSYKNLDEHDAAIKSFERVININAGNKIALFEIRQIKKLRG